MNLIPKYKYKYYQMYIRYLVAYMKGTTNSNGIDLVFVIPDTSRGWILEAICKEISKDYEGNFQFCYDLSSLPVAENYFFPHYSWLSLAMLSNPKILGKNFFVLYTHPKGIVDDSELIFFLKKTKKVFSLCSKFTKLLVNCGLNENKVGTVLGAAYPEEFLFHERTEEGYIGISTAYYERKEPERIFELINMMQNRNFLLLGKNWENFNKFNELSSFENLTYLDVPYAQYASYYQKMSVFLTMSSVEGGPFSLIEAMMSNVFPVASDTGFAADIIVNGENGFIFDVNSPLENICDLIERSYRKTTNVRETVIDLTWKKFNKKIISSFRGYV